jgi:pyrroloquinoline quinone (PQQ) biosynthesis protein C
MYHYIKDFPEAIRHAEEQAEGELKNLLHEYARQETGHEEFVLRTLEGIGLTREEVANATPLVSTRAVSFMMRSLADLHPSSMLLMAALVEAQDFDETVIEKFTSTLEANYGIARQVFKPYFDHQRIDVEMGHAKLLQENLSLVDIGTQPLLDRVINDLHDLKHSFELQGQEIKQYYGENLNGRYVPRQPMYFDSIS